MHDTIIVKMQNTFMHPQANLNTNMNKDKALTHNNIYINNNIDVDNDQELIVGKLFFRRAKGFEWQEFSYSDKWIEHGFQIDPELPLEYGLFRASLHEFGCFKDSSPDSWGRSLIRKMFKNQNKSSLFFSDYLLSVSDDYRVGAFRFYDLDNNLISGSNYKNIHSQIPATSELRTFQYIIDNFQSNKKIIDKDFIDILHRGSSLGGARPKLSISDQDSLLIAKFSSKTDTYDVPAREAISLAIARASKINVPDFKLVKLDIDKSVLMLKRFDRNAMKRIPYMSAMTFLQAIDGTSNNYSYLDIANIIENNSKETVTSDLVELFRRMILNIMLGNKDDHLKNHGFLYVNNNWKLSPVFDLEISIDKSHHSLALDDKGSLYPDIQSLLNTSEYYGIEKCQAKDIILEIAEYSYDWRKFGKELFIENSTLNKLPDEKLYLNDIKVLSSYL